MPKGTQKTDHVWLVMIKAMHALTRYAAAGIEGTGLGNSDFRCWKCYSTRDHYL
jgi:hypothetical protein